MRIRVRVAGESVPNAVEGPSLLEPGARAEPAARMPHVPVGPLQRRPFEPLPTTTVIRVIEADVNVVGEDDSARLLIVEHRLAYVV